MSDKLRKQIDVEREQINRLIDEHRSLLEKAASENPTTIEVSALASLLHSFYSGIENVFKRIANEIDGELPAGLAWHRKLLDDIYCRSSLLLAGLLFQQLLDVGR